MKYFCLFLLGFATFSYANERPDLEFKPEVVEQTKAWAQNAKIEIERGFSFIARQGVAEHEDMYRGLIDDILESSSRNNESIMRFILFRAQAIHDIMDRQASSPKKNATSRRFLKAALEKALGVYEKDISLFQAMAEKKEIMRPLEYAVQSFQWTHSVLDYHYQISTNKARLDILKQSLVIWLNDSAKDARYNRQLAPVTSNLKRFYESVQGREPQSNLEALELSRNIRSFLEDELELAGQLIDNALAAEDQLEMGPEAAAGTPTTDAVSVVFSVGKKHNSDLFTHTIRAESLSQILRICQQKLPLSYKSHFDYLSVSINGGDAETNYKEIGYWRKRDKPCGKIIQLVVQKSYLNIGVVDLSSTYQAIGILDDDPDKVFNIMANTKVEARMQCQQTLLRLGSISKMYVSHFRFRNAVQNNYIYQGDVISLCGKLFK